MGAGVTAAGAAQAEGVLSELSQMADTQARGSGKSWWRRKLRGVPHSLPEAAASLRGGGEDTEGVAMVLQAVGSPPPWSLAPVDRSQSSSGRHGALSPAAVSIHSGYLPF